MGYKPKATKRRRKLNAARIARYRARLRLGQSVFKVEGNKADIILALRGLAHTAGMHEFMLTPEASHEEIGEKLSLLLGQIADRWREYFGMKARDLEIVSVSLKMLLDRKSAKTNRDAKRPG